MSAAAVVDRSVGLAALAEIRQILSMPDKVAAQWEALSAQDRQMLLKSATLTAAYVRLPWANIPEQERGEIRAAARRAKNWALKLEL